MRRASGQVQGASTARSTKTQAPSTQHRGREKLLSLARPQPQAEDAHVPDANPLLDVT